MRAVLVTALLLAACRPKDLPLATLAERLDFAETPRLPAPEAGSYAVLEVKPRDPVLARLLDGYRYDSALAGGAAGLALAAAEGKGGFTRWELREALWRGGWAFGVREARVWQLAAGDPPNRELIAWLESVPKDVPMALVRARGRRGDVWVGLRADPPPDLGVLPRLAALGSLLVLPPVPGATWRVTDAQGTPTEGPLDQGAQIVLAVAGEWLVDVRDARGEIARFPVYVGMEGPDAPLLRLPDAPETVTNALDADALAVRLLAHVRDAYGVAPWKRSPVFDGAVQRYVADPSLGSAGVLAPLGFAGRDAIVWACDQPTVQTCLDTWVWDQRRRRTLLTDQMDSYGLHVTLDAEGVHLTLLLVDAD